MASDDPVPRDRYREVGGRADAGAARAPESSLLLASLVGGVLLGPGVDLEWSAPVGCPERDEVQADVDRLLGDRRLAVEDAVRAAITRTSDGHEAFSAIATAWGRQRGRSAPRCLGEAGF